MSPLVFLIFMIAVCEKPLHITAQNIICRDNNECDPESCCSMGEQRYSVPTCIKMQTTGELCRPEPKKIVETTFRYPDDSEITVKRAYLGICPCMAGLTCLRSNGTCVKT